MAFGGRWRRSGAGSRSDEERVRAGEPGGVGQAPEEEEPVERLRTTASPARLLPPRLLPPPACLACPACSACSATSGTGGGKVRLQWTRGERGQGCRRASSRVSAARRCGWACLVSWPYMSPRFTTTYLPRMSQGDLGSHHCAPPACLFMLCPALLGLAWVFGAFLPTGRIGSPAPGLPPGITGPPCPPQGQLPALCLLAVNKCRFANVFCHLPEVLSPLLVSPVATVSSSTCFEKQRC